MSVAQEDKANNPVNPLAEIPLEKLAFIAAVLFFIGSGISFYIAYQRLKELPPKGTVGEVDEVGEEVIL